VVASRHDTFVTAHDHPKHPPTDARVEAVELGRELAVNLQIAREHVTGRQRREIAHEEPVVGGGLRGEWGG
jgi:hypothetical protein